ncbi:MAG: hypothetical protein MI754_00105 [Chromatiales bacterium]|nr:hypothetical protein [Chromatiales bacterium]
MAERSDDDGVIIVLLERFAKQRLPRALRLKRRVDKGEKLSEADLAFLKEVLEELGQMKPLMDKHPEYQKLAVRVLRLYREIIEQALENEQDS